MNPEQNVLKALQALAECDRDRQASPEVEARLKLAFRRNESAKRQRQVSAWAIAAAAMIAILASLARLPQPIEGLPVERPAESAASAPALRAPASAVLLPPAPRVRPRHPAGREIMTDFFPLMDVPPPIGRGALVRVDLPAEAMRTVGLPVREDRLAERVQADVLLSEDGLATAIRFVKVSQ
jgi:hypothetical protein